MTSESATAPLLEVQDLHVSFAGADRTRVSVVHGVGFSVAAGETLAIVGESGSGKSVTALSILRLLPSGAGRIESGSIRLRGRELTTLADEEIRAVRGRHIGMIFQEPMTSLNPVHTVGAQIAEVAQRHEGLGRDAARRHAIEMLALVGMPDPAWRADRYPHELSGGMRQRVMIAMALSCRPSLLIADEPTTALDVTIQAQILDLMADLQSQLGMAMVFITHDLSVVAQVADRAAVMYAGEIVETASVSALFTTPRMPYTAGLLDSMPRLGRSRAGQPLPAIPGQVPTPASLPPGCRFSTRCMHADAQCRVAVPPLEAVAADHAVRCLHWRRLSLADRSHA